MQIQIVMLDSPSSHELMHRLTYSSVVFTECYHGHACIRTELGGGHKEARFLVGRQFPGGG